MSAISSGCVIVGISSNPAETSIHPGFFASGFIYESPKIGWLINTTSSAPGLPSALVTGIDATATAFIPEVDLLIEPSDFQFFPPSRER